MVEAGGGFGDLAEDAHVEAGAGKRMAKATTVLAMLNGLGTRGPA